MTDMEYLEAILKSQDLADDSAEMKDLQKRRGEVEAVLRAAFPKCRPTIRYSGSKAKGTLIKEAYDLDIASYFPHDDGAAGSTLKEIYEDTAAALEKGYNVIKKRSALRVRGKDFVDFHIDVVPGRFTDDTKGDCYLHQEGADKERLKTNLDVHIEHVCDSGFPDAIRLLKLWKVRKALGVKQFAFELLIIKLLADTRKSLPDQMKHVLTELRDEAEPVAIEDPANPQGNDLSDLMSPGVWAELKAAATVTLAVIDAVGWTSVFGQVPSGDKIGKLKAAVAAVTVPTRPWCD